MTRRTRESILIAIWAALSVLFSYWLGQQAYTWLPPQATVEAKHVDDLFSFLVGLGTLVFLGVVSMIIYAVMTCQAPKDDYREGHTVRGNDALEITWTVIPTVLVMWIAVQNLHIYELVDIQGLNQFGQNPAQSTLYATTGDLAQADLTTPTRTETIEVTAKQWGWSFYYPEADLTVNELHLPTDHAVRLVLHSDDVIHGFYVPEFRVKQDIVPGHKLEFTVRPILAGQFKLHDSQFSGTYYALMEADVFVDEPDAYQRWLATTQAQPVAATPNAALEEYQHPPEHVLGRDWPTTMPPDADAIDTDAIAAVSEPL